MSDMTIPDDLAEQLREIARQENRQPEDVLRDMLTDYRPTSIPPPVKSAVEREQKTRQQDEAERRVQQRIYARARRYWKQVGDTERLNLTDEELDAQFWLIDHEGIPRLESEQGTIELPPDPLLEMGKRAEELGLRSGRDDISENFDAILRETWTEHLMQKRNRNEE